MKTLNIIETAYRATIEEQDDTVVWISHAMKGAGADLGVLLSGNAVNYAVKAQDATGLSFGRKQQTQPPQLAKDIAALLAKGVAVHVIEEDVAERGLERHELVDGLTPISRRDLPALFEKFHQVWRW